MTTVIHFSLGALLGIALGVCLLIAGGLAWQPPVPKCPGCATLTQPWGHCEEQVQGGWVCG